MEKDKTCRDIYFEMRSMNRHLQRVGNIGMLALLLKLSEGLEDDKNGKRLLKAAAILVGVVEVLLFHSFLRFLSKYATFYAVNPTVTHLIL